MTDPSDHPLRKAFEKLGETPVDPARTRPTERPILRTRAAVEASRAKHYGLIDVAIHGVDLKEIDLSDCIFEWVELKEVVLSLQKEIAQLRQTRVAKAAPKVSREPNDRPRAKTREPVKCHECGGLGHIRRFCTARQGN